MRMGFQYADDDIDEFKIRRDIREAAEGWLINAAFRDILAGKFDTSSVHFALQLGHHEDYPKLKQAHENALRAARHMGI